MSTANLLKIARNVTPASTNNDYMSDTFRRKNIEDKNILQKFCLTETPEICNSVRLRLSNHKKTIKYSCIVAN